MMASSLPPSLDRILHTVPMGSGPLYHVRAPGRLNLIGEHTDYNGLPVLPFAIDAAVHILLSPLPSPEIEVHAIDFPDAPPSRFSIETTIPPSEQGHWINYVKAAVQDGVRYGLERGVDPKSLVGFRAFISGDLPKNAGLSSSSALVVAAALAFYRLQTWDIPAAELAIRCAEAERYVGTRGGGMDQTTSLCGRRNNALKMYFDPLEIQLVPVRVPCSFLVAQSRVEAAKSGAARFHYNQRVLECRLLTAVIGRAFRDEGLLESPLHRLGDLRKIPQLPSLSDLTSRALDAFPSETLSYPDLQSILGKDTVDSIFLPEFSDLVSHLPDPLPLRRRARYLLHEWRRVEAAADALDQGDLKSLGSLLYEAHEGLSKEYEVSHPKVDALIDLARGFGLPGARMVGAGFGGSTLHLVPTGEEERYTGFLSQRFYQLPADVVAERYVHCFHPEEGAGISRLSDRD